MQKKLYAFFLALVLFSGCIEPPVPDGGSASWLIMVYLDSDNNLEPNSIFDMDKLESVGSTDDIIMVVQWDRAPGYDSSNGDWMGTKRFLVKKGSQDGLVESQEIMDLGEVDMGDMGSLSDFVKWAMQKYPAERHLLDVWDHGSGWGSHTQDETSGTEASVQGLAEALGNAGFGPEKKLDLLVLNQCLMGQIDVAYAMQPYAKVLVASEEVIPGPGIDYAGPLSTLVQEPAMDERQLARLFVDEYERFYTEDVPQPFTTLAAYDLGKMDIVAGAAAKFTVALSRNVEQNWPKIGRSIYFAEAFAKFGGMATVKSVSSYDLLDFAGLATQEINDAGLGTAAEELKAALNEMLIAEYHGKEHPFANGLAVYFPEDEIIYQQAYPEASHFAVESGWDNFLKAYIAAEKTDEIAPSLVIDRVSSKTVNMNSPVSLYGTATGNNIVTLYRVIGTVQGDMIFMLNNHPLTQAYTDYKGERKLPEFFDGENNIDFTWAPAAEVLTNGQKQVIAPLYPLGDGDYYFSASGSYKQANEAKPFDARLVFDYRTGQLLQATRLTDIGAQQVPSDFTPQKGDSFTPYMEFYNMQTQEYGVANADSISFGDDGLWIDLTLLPEGQYMVGLFVGDLSGNFGALFEPITVAGQPQPNPSVSNSDVAGNWLGDGLGFNILADGTCTSIVGIKQNSCVYWFRNNNGLPLMSFLIDAGEAEPVYVVFMVEAAQNKLVLTELFEGGKYVLWKDGIKQEEPEKEIDLAILGKWVNELGYLEFKQNGSYVWEVKQNVIVGTFHTKGGEIFLGGKGGETAYSYTSSGNSLQITDSEGSTISFSKPVSPVQPSSNPLAGRWYNAPVNETAVFNADGTYQSYISGALFVSGTYNISGNTLALNGAYGTFFYTFAISGNTLILFDNFYGTYASYVKVS